MAYDSSEEDEETPFHDSPTASTARHHGTLAAAATISGPPMADRTFMNRLMAGGMGTLQSHMAGRHYEQLMEERNLCRNRVHELEEQERERKRKEDKEKKKKERKEGKQPEQPPQPGPSGEPGGGGGDGGDGGDDDEDDEYDDDDHARRLGGLNIPSEEELRRQAKILGLGGKGPKMKVPESFTGKRDDVTRFI